MSTCGWYRILNLGQDIDNKLSDFKRLTESSFIRTEEVDEQSLESFIAFKKVKTVSCGQLAVMKDRERPKRGG